MGQEQAEALGRLLRMEPFDAIYSSPRLRTVQTGQAIAAGRAIDVQTEDSLDEIDFDEWTGRSFAELEGNPDWVRWNERRSQARCPGGESMVEAQARAAHFVGEVAERHSGGQIVLVTHCDIIRALLCHEHGRSLDDILSFEAGPASVTRLQRGNARRAAA